MAAAAPTHDCLPDASSVNATLAEMLTVPLGWGGGGFGFGFDTAAVESCSSPPPLLGGGGGAAGRALHLVQRAANAVDLSFTVPDHPAIGSLASNRFSGRYELALPDAKMLLGLQLSVFAGVVFGVIFATVLYLAFLKNGKKNAVPPLRRALVGFPLFLASLLLPYRLIDSTGVQNTALRFSISVLFVLYQFRTLEAIFGFVPLGATSSWKVYCAYFSLPFDMPFDPKTNEPVRATSRDVRDGWTSAARQVACIAALCSVLSPFGYVPFGEAGASAADFQGGFDVGAYLNARHLGNCFAIAIYFQQALAIGDAVFGIMIQTVFGYKVKQSMRNPMLEATSPSDFWGRRWNLLVHAAMKRGVYKPVRALSSSPVLASLAVFVASGLFHEWLVHVVFLHSRPPGATSGVFLGSNASFFLWNFFVIVGEKLLAGSRGVRSVGRTLPRAMVPFVIVMTSLPVAHWFRDPYMHGGFLQDYEKCLPLIRRT